MAEYLTMDTLMAFLTLTSLEIVLGIDNVIFIAILAGRLPESQRDYARKLGLSIAVVSRIILLLCIGYVMRLTQPWFTIWEYEFTGKDAILLVGGIFLIGKATYEIHHKVQGHDEIQKASGKHASFVPLMIQVALIDVVFSLDSVITAVGMSNQLPVMIAAVIVAVGIMIIFSGAVVRFVDKNPAIKILALSFLLLIGVLLVAEGFHQKIDKGYVYFAMAFSLGVELLQMGVERRKKKHLASPPPTTAV